MTSTEMVYSRGVFIDVTTLAYAIHSMDEQFKVDIGIGQLTVTDIAGMLKDAASGAKLLNQIGAKGGYYTKEIKGVRYVILTGRAGLRTLLKGTKYLPANPKMVKFGIGPIGAAAAARSNFIFSMTMYTALDLAGYIAGDVTLSQLTGNAIWNAGSTALSIAASAAAVALVGTVFTAALPAIGVGLVVGAMTSAFLNSVNEDLQVAAALSEALDSTAARFRDDPASRDQLCQVGAADNFLNCVRLPTGATGGGGGSDPGQSDGAAQDDPGEFPFDEPVYDDDDQQGTTGPGGEGDEPDIGGMITIGYDQNGNVTIPPQGEKEEYPGEKDHKVLGPGSN